MFDPGVQSDVSYQPVVRSNGSKLRKRLGCEHQAQRYNISANCFSHLLINKMEAFLWFQAKLIRIEKMD